MCVCGQASINCVCVRSRWALNVCACGQVGINCVVCVCGQVGINCVHVGRWALIVCVWASGH